MPHLKTPGTPSIRIVRFMINRRRETREKDADSLFQTSFADTSSDIKPGDIPKLFKEFIQLGFVYTKKHEGTGLVLALSKRVAELHNGRIWVEREFGKGSRFTFTLPVKRKLQGRRQEPGAGSKNETSYLFEKRV